MDTSQPDDHVDASRRERLARASSLAMDAGEYADVPAEILAMVRTICRPLPQAVENQAWAGFQWRVRHRIFAHVLTVDFPDGPVTVLTFRSPGPELEALRGAGHPFFTPAWGKDAVGMVLEPDVSWAEVRELVVDSYRSMAPKMLADQLDRPSR